MKMIPVPNPPKSAYNPERPPGTLLQSQLLHLEWAVRPAGERAKAGFHVVPAQTEAEAAERIAQLTRRLLPDLPEPKKARTSLKGSAARRRRSKKRSGR